MTMDNYVLMFLMTLLTPLVTAFITAASNLLTKHSAEIWNRLTRVVGPAINSVSIRHASTCSSKYANWTPLPGDLFNDTIIDAILDHMSTMKIYSDLMMGKLGQADKSEGYKSTSNMRDRRIDLIPMSEVSYGDFTYKYSEIDKEENGTKQHTKLFTISSKLPVGEITDFIKACYTKYTKRIYDSTDTRQYLYKLANGDLLYKKYLISNNMTFDQIYFPQKKKIIEMLEKLRLAEISKFTMLLSGAPGLGKTSIIKSIAAATGYSIIEVKLSMVKSDIDLINIFHEQSLSYNRANDKTLNRKQDEVPLNKRIYILEDIDAECSIVHQRVDTTKDTKTKELTEAIKAITAKKSEVIVLGEDTLPPLTLSGVLNALDGVLELNGAILIMTTNYEKKLDAALTRPGRITMNIKLEKMLHDDAVKHINRYFPDTSIAYELLPDFAVTPAELDSYLQIASSIDELLTLIK